MNQADKKRGLQLRNALGPVLDTEACYFQCNSECGNPCIRCGHSWGRHSDNVHGPCNEPGCKCQGFIWEELQEAIDQVKLEFGLEQPL